MSSVEQWQKEIEEYEKQLFFQSKKKSPSGRQVIDESWTHYMDPIAIQLYQWIQSDFLQSTFQSTLQLEPDDSIAVRNEKQHLLHKELARTRLLALVQGGMSTHSNTALLTHLPLSLYVSKKALDKVGHFYQFTQTGGTAETILSLRLFIYSFLPKQVKYEEWRSLTKDGIACDQNEPMYLGREDMVSEAVVKQLLKQIIRMSLYKQIGHRRVPFKRLLLGAYQASVSYKSMQSLTMDAQCFYKKRWLHRFSEY
ncbi:EcsC family protein [Shouchella lehensis]|uniref:EcsC family protein n=1 Tax=Shouchella lehensis G1 TaxID=1246626 RepID=A0A060LVK6_9BACI|nr:EcsC family protein [Shouchella lehensis]AIC95296.1 hypothetical protein BleG1_2731 [Shouchella lehensis G1]